MSVWKPWARKPASYEADQESNSTYLTDDQPYFSDEQMLESPWLAMWDMRSPRQLEKAKLIRELEKVSGQSFLVKRASLTAVNGSAGGMEHLVLRLDHVPVIQELAPLLLGQYGGGVYNLYAKSRPRAKLHSYTLPGEPKYPRADDMDGGQGDATKDFAARMAQEALASMERTNPRAYQHIGLMLLEKEFGLKLDALMQDDDDDDKDWEENLIRKHMESNPEFKEAYLQAVLEAKFR